MRLLYVLCLGALLAASDARPAVTSDVAVRSPIDWWPFNDKPKPKPKPAITDADLKNPKLVDHLAKYNTWINNKGKTTLVGRRCASTAKTCAYTVKNPPKLKKGEFEQIICKVKNDGQCVYPYFLDFRSGFRAAGDNY
jgi:hypothetical protein